MSKEAGYNNRGDVSTNHQEGLRKARFLERQKKALENLREAGPQVNDGPQIYQIVDPPPQPPTPPPLYGWKHGQPIRHRRLDNQARDSVSDLLRRREPHESSSQSAAGGGSSDAAGGGALSAPARRRHFKV